MTIDEQRQGIIARLEEALADVHAVQRRWEAALDPDRVTGRLDAAHDRARNRLADRAGVLTQDIANLTDIRGWDGGDGGWIDLFAPAISPHPSDGTELGVRYRLSSLMNLDNVLRRALGVANDERQYAARRISRERPVSEHDRTRDQILKVLADWDETGTSATMNAQAIAERLNLPLEKIQYHLRILANRGEIEDASGFGPGPSEVRITTLGLQIAHEGRAAVEGAPNISQSSTFLISGGINTFAQTGTGDIFQTVQQPAELEQIRLLLAELRRGIAALDASDETREEALVYVEQLSSELARREARPSMLKVPWNRLQEIATLEGARQGGAFVLETIGKLAPLVTQLFGGPPAPPATMA